MFANELRERAISHRTATVKSAAAKLEERIPKIRKLLEKAADSGQFSKVIEGRSIDLCYDKAVTDEFTNQLIALLTSPEWGLKATHNFNGLCKVSWGVGEEKEDEDIS